MGKIEKFRECPAVGRRIKPVAHIVPILIQIEAFLRCLRRSSLG